MQRSGDEGGVDILPTSCPMREAPSCLRWALIRTLELGGSNYLPTNWMGFAEYFRINLEQMELTSAEEVIGYWVDWHPSCHSNTVCKVFKFARDQGHQKLLEIFDTLVQGEMDYVIVRYPVRKNQRWPFLWGGRGGGSITLDWYSSCHRNT